MKLGYRYCGLREIRKKSFDFPRILLRSLQTIILTTLSVTRVSGLIDIAIIYLVNNFY